MLDDEQIYEIELDESPIPERTRRLIDEATVRRDGCIWRVHHNDPDPFPSKPHAHNLESGLKLNLSNGDLWFRNQKQPNPVSRKRLMAIRQAFAVQGVEMPLLAV